jgi:hypothetical protein
MRTEHIPGNDLGRRPPSGIAQRLLLGTVGKIEKT